jgi:hypothetical protein
VRYWGKIKTEDRIQKDVALSESDFVRAVAAICDSLDYQSPSYAPSIMPK